MAEAAFAFSQRVTQDYLGLDRLHRAANPDDAWGLVVLNMSSLEPTVFADFAHARETFEHLERDAQALETPDRHVYYSELCRSALGVIDWNQRAMDLDEQVTRFLAAPSVPAQPEALEQLRAQLHNALGGLGFAGTLETRAAAWEAAHRVDPGDLETTMNALIAEARERCTALFGPIDCPNPTVHIVSAVGFNARCDFARLRIELNRDPILTRPALKHLVLHEVFPGHCLQFEWRRRAAQEGWGYEDALLSLVKSASSPLFEGLADIGGQLLDWENPDDLVQNLMGRYRAGLGTVAAHGLHALGWTLPEAATYLRRHALIGGEGWVQNRLAYIAGRGRGAHIWSYWLGEQRLRPLVAPQPDHATLRFLYGRTHSLASVALQKGQETS
jgi:hypothetical protein